MPVTDFDFLSHSPEETRHLGARLGALLLPGDVLCLQGELGAGKTTFTQGLAQGWGTFDAVSSPTFIIVNVYRRADGGQLYHLDTYRIDSGPEAEELDIDAMLMRGPLVVEWPERMENVLPDERLWITLEHVDDAERRFRFEAHGARAVELLERIRESIA
ncbi:MAG: tRNA (adenosine(37)-N6)-threonylcarbamoyltransferase complex ATPase subunit type 1 TsaE [Anaerolineales bacterium]